MSLEIDENGNWKIKFASKEEEDAFNAQIEEDIKKAEIEIDAMIEEESKKPFEMPTQEEIDTERQYWLKEKDSPFKNTCLGLLDTTEKMLKFAKALKHRQGIGELVT